MKSLLIELWELLLPRHCSACGRKLLATEQAICFPCLSRLPYTDYHRKEYNPMERELWGKVPLGRATAYLLYGREGRVQRLIFDLKYHKHPEVGKAMGRIMAADLRANSFFDDIDWIIPVPLHPHKKRIRGYNQCECLAEGIAEVTGIPIHTEAVERNSYTETQTHKWVGERWENMEGRFTCLIPEQLAGKHILLVDDVFTTGATIVACADAFRGISGLRISVLTLAMAGRE